MGLEFAFFLVFGFCGYFASLFHGWLPLDLGVFALLDGDCISLNFARLLLDMEMNYFSISLL